ncbi:aminoacyl-tRNA hydrolase [Candidatus Desantisbacteria bacterium]|nr:aminoacyl-tRNA hydrolase [Candidatus Desantisbacteria bacterium]
MIRKLIVGLGNPGQKYSFTRHNIGFLVVDAYAAYHNVNFNFKKCNSLLAMINESEQDGKKIIIAKPETYMNSSGKALSELIMDFSISLEDILIISDDVNIPFGKFRFRPSGTHGGHNGLLSIIDSLSTDKFPRLRIGIGDSLSKLDLKKYVLMNFTGEEITLIKENIIKTAIKAVDVFINDGISCAMNKFNAIDLNPGSTHLPII